jgi:hypothetical protein
MCRSFHYLLFQTVEEQLYIFTHTHYCCYPIIDFLKQLIILRHGKLLVFALPG